MPGLLRNEQIQQWGILKVQKLSDFIVPFGKLSLSFYQTKKAF